MIKPFKMEEKNEITSKNNQIEELTKELKTLNDKLKKNIALINELEERIKIFQSEYIRRTIKFSELRKKYTNKQISTLKRRPFYFDETEFLYHQQIGSYDVSDLRKENAVDKMFLQIESDSPIMRLKVNYIHKRDTNGGGDGVPDIIYFVDCVHYFEIMEDGQLIYLKKETLEAKDWALIEL